MRSRFVLVTLAAIVAGCLGIHGQLLGPETTLDIAVPPAVASNAARRMNGEATAAVAILVLDDVEVDTSQAVSIKVYGPSPSSQPEARGALLGSASLVGSSPGDRAAPLDTMDLVIPMNDEASVLLATRPASIKLMFQVSGAPDRSSLKFRRAYFLTSEDRPGSN